MQKSHPKGDRSLAKNVGFSIPTAVLYLLLITSPVSAKLYINEFSSATADDWIEIYNDGADAVDLTKFKIRDSSATNKLNLTGTISSHSFLPLDWYNRLNKSGDEIKIVSVTDDVSIEDSVSYGDKNEKILSPNENQTIGRSPDGGETWIVYGSGTKGWSNTLGQIAPSATPTNVPTVAPTDTPSPTKTPTPVKTLTPTKIPSPTKVPTPTKSTLLPTTFLTPTPITAQTKNTATIMERKDDAGPTAVLGADTRVTDKKLSPSPAALVKGKKEVNFWSNIKGILVIAVSFICFICAILGYLWIQKKEKMMS